LIHFIFKTSIREWKNVTIQCIFFFWMFSAFININFLPCTSRETWLLITQFFGRVFPCEVVHCQCPRPEKQTVSRASDLRLTKLWRKYKYSHHRLDNPPPQCQPLEEQRELNASPWSGSTWSVLRLWNCKPEQHFHR